MSIFAVPLHSFQVLFYQVLPNFADKIRIDYFKSLMSRQTKYKHSNVL